MGARYCKASRYGRWRHLAGGLDVVELAPAASRPAGLSESFGTLRYGGLTELLLYDARRTATLAGPTGVFVAPEVETWIKARASAREVAHLINVPSNPPGWSAGKCGEWYPDVLDTDAS